MEPHVSRAGGQGHVEVHRVVQDVPVRGGLGHEHQVPGWAATRVAPVATSTAWREISRPPTPPGPPPRLKPSLIPLSTKTRTAVRRLATSRMLLSGFCSPWTTSILVIDKRGFLVKVKPAVATLVLAFRPDHQPVLARQHRAVVVAEHVRRPFVHRPLGELRRLVEHRHQRVAAPDPVLGPQRCPPLPRGRQYNACTPRNGSPFISSRLSSGTAVTSSSPISESPPTSAGGATGPPHTGRSRTPGRSTAGCRRRRPRPIRNASVFGR